MVQRLMLSRKVAPTAWFRFIWVQDLVYDMPFDFDPAGVRNISQNNHSSVVSDSDCFLPDTASKTSARQFPPSFSGLTFDRARRLIMTFMKVSSCGAPQSLLSYNSGKCHPGKSSNTTPLHDHNNRHLHCGSTMSLCLFQNVSESGKSHMPDTQLELELEQ